MNSGKLGQVLRREYNGSRTKTRLSTLSNRSAAVRVLYPSARAQDNWQTHQKGQEGSPEGEVPGDPAWSGGSHLPVPDSAHPGPRPSSVLQGRTSPSSLSTAVVHTKPGVQQSTNQ